MDEIKQSLRAPCKVGDIVQPIRSFCSRLGAAMERDPNHGWEVMDIVVGDRHNGDGPTELTVIHCEHPGMYVQPDGSFGVPAKVIKHYIDPCNVRVIVRQ